MGTCLRPKIVNQSKLGPHFEVSKQMGALKCSEKLAASEDFAVVPCKTWHPLRHFRPLGGLFHGTSV